jgi:hypothetical protein
MRTAALVRIKPAVVIGERASTRPDPPQNRPGRGIMIRRDRLDPL